MGSNLTAASLSGIRKKKITTISPNIIIDKLKKGVSKIQWTSISSSSTKNFELKKIRSLDKGKSIRMGTPPPQRPQNLADPHVYALQSAGLYLIWISRTFWNLMAMPYNNAEIGKIWFSFLTVQIGGKFWCGSRFWIKLMKGHGLAVRGKTKSWTNKDKAKLYSKKKKTRTTNFNTEIDINWNWSNQLSSNQQVN